jgi:uncharacterized protein
MVVSGNLTNEEIDRVLAKEYIGRIGCHEDGKTYIVPITYSYDMNSSSIIGYSGDGMKIRMLRSNPIVCFEVEKINDVSNWQTVISWGRFEELQGADARNAIHSFVHKVESLINNGSEEHHSFLKDISGSNNVNSIIYKISLIEKTGKFERS